MPDDCSGQSVYNRGFQDSSSDTGTLVSRRLPSVGGQRLGSMSSPVLGTGTAVGEPQLGHGRPSRDSAARRSERFAREAAGRQFWVRESFVRFQWQESTERDCTSVCGCWVSCGIDLGCKFESPRTSECEPTGSLSFYSWNPACVGCEVDSLAEN